MADGPDAVALLTIAALPPTTARQIGSGQVLVDPSSVVKELIDNAMDARAKSIFVDITTNTIDSIQVKDDGHGIPAEDRPLVCRRYCTSKIRDFHDLRYVEGKWLGFRGEALSSMAEMSGSFHVTTRVEGEPVAVKLIYGRNGELAAIEHESHPVGTTIKVAKFFEHIPVRKQTAIKNSAKLFAKIRRMMQAYALARPTISLRLRVLKAKNSKGDFVYAPNASANIEEAVLKVIGKDCALQCDWTALEAENFEIHAFLPKPTANGPKIASHGAFVSIDARPMSSSRGIIKQVIKAFKDRLRKSNPSLAGVKDPFFCMNIICPPDSYDPNIEPAKDDVMFENGDVVLGVVDKLLKSYYPEAIVKFEEIKSPTSAQQPYEIEEEEPLVRDQTPISVHEDSPAEPSEQPASEPPSEQLRWRSSMYGIDEDDLEFLQDNQAPVTEHEEGCRAVDVSNPWTIARMNAVIKPKQPISNGQLLSPAKSQSDFIPLPSSPIPAITPHRASPVQPLTPQTSSRTNMERSSLDYELEQSVQQLARISSTECTLGAGSEERKMPRRREQSELRTSSHFAQVDLQRPDSRCFQLDQVSPASNDMPPPALSAPRRSQRKQQPYTNKSFAPPAQQLNDMWVRKPMPGLQPSQPSRRQKRSKHQEVSMFPSDIPSCPCRPVLTTAEHLIENRLYSEDNNDIRDVFGRRRGPQRSDQSSQLKSQLSLAAVGGNRSFPRSTQRDAPTGGSSRASSAEPQPRSKNIRDKLLLNPGRGISAEPRDMAEQFRAYAEREGRPRPSSVGSQTSMLFDARSPNLGGVLHMRSNNGAGPDSRNIARQSEVYVRSHPKEPAPGAPSVGSERSSLLHPISTEVTATLKMHGHGRLTQNSQDMQAYFRSHEAPSSNPPKIPIRGNEPRAAPLHETTAKPRRLRRRTIDGLEYTKSSKLPIERTLPGFCIADLVLQLPISLEIIFQSSRKLDMSRNSLDWGYAAEDAYDVFFEPVSERKIMDWVLKLDGILNERYEKKGGVDTRCELHEGIQRVIDARKEQDEIIETIESVVEVLVSVIDNDMAEEFDSGMLGKVNGNVVQQNDAFSHRVDAQQPGIKEDNKSDDDMFDFDMSQFMDLDADESTGIIRKDDERPIKMEDDYGDDIEDEMLMDL
ncbi:hypothetical protein EJ02DRAFT_420648 [Clathrospora elynae]|uniref:DNA mismatch repair protein S5 domain-containing protein n=1 Tax=Clathrospora elynae TaxID=706981 RepID=A0A6A5SXJ7_9PLEO|nr:hypothetical protein EJ02DRAFT_420648 [Clathrospora elynae]